MNDPRILNTGWRKLLFGAGMLLLAIIALINGAFILPDALELPAEAPRHRLYRFLLVEHGHLLALGCAGYAMLVIFTYRREIAAAITRTAVLRLAGLLLLAVIAAVLAVRFGNPFR